MNRQPPPPPPPSRLRNGKSFDVFEFNENDDSFDEASKRLTRKHRNPRKAVAKDSPIDKFKFLQQFMRGTISQQPKISNEPIDVDDEEGMETPKKVVSDIVVEVDDSVSGHLCIHSVSHPKGMSPEDGALKTDNSSLDVILLSSSSEHENEVLDITSGGDDGYKMRSTWTSSSLLAVTLEELKECGSGRHGIDILNMAVFVIPDLIYCGKIFCTESFLTFSCCSIKVEGLNVNGTKRSFISEWAIDDVINIESKWFANVSTAVVILIFKPKDSTAPGNAKETSGIEQLYFTVNDPYWFERQEAIISLDVRYKDLWNIFFNTDEENDSKFLRQKSKLLSKKYYQDWDGPFEDLIFPKGDPDAVLISKSDIELLKPDSFINDTIIDFYIKYLKNKIQPVHHQRFHFFNSFFFRKLADLNKDQASACEGRAAFQRVHKWTRKVNLFEKDYIFIPVNYSFHWSLIVICHPGEVAGVNGKFAEIDLLRVPCILHMDSIKGSHRGLKNLFQSYLYEWKERHKETVADVSLKFLQLRFVPLELPQQKNSFDYGLFLLHFVERFLDEAPINFSPFKITKFSNFVS
ncbi:LOW QUALITY PROTEIN: Peptidase_C48 domain-containing protein, partial [Cephalotus follicularis]